MDVGPDIGHIIIKEEVDFLVKKENETSEDGFICARETIKKIRESSCAECDAKQIVIENLNASKKKLINELTSAKQDGQDYLSQFNACEKKYEALVLSTTQRENEFKSSQQQQQLDHTNEIKRMNAELACFKNQAHNDQDENEYDVEAIVAHKKQNRNMKYLIRWKGYASSDDTWETEKNLTCPQILKKYKKENNLL